MIGPLSERQYQDVFQYMVYPWFMLLLFVISGMNARYSLSSRSHKEFLRMGTRKYLVPSSLGLLVFGWILGYYNMMISGALEQAGTMPKPVLFFIMAVSGTGPLWYIQMLWVFSLALVLFRIMEKDRLYRLCGKAPVPVLILFVFLIWGSAQILNMPVIVVYRFGIYGLGFFLGYLFFSHDGVMDRLEAWRIPLILAMAVSGIAFVLLYWGRPYAEHSVLDTFMCNLFAWMGVLAVLAGMKRWGNFENPFSRFMCKESWGLYLFHYLPLAMTAWYLSFYEVSMPGVCYYLITGAAAFAGSIILYEVIKRIPIIRWLVCGIGGK